MLFLLLFLYLFKLFVKKIGFVLHFDKFCIFSLFHFHDHRIDEGLRVFLESFRLPGESPIIERIMESFSEDFYVSKRYNILDHNCFY